MKRILSCLEDGELSAKEIQQATGLDKGYVSRKLKFLRELGKVHIARFRLASCRHVQEAVYALGFAKDADPITRRPPAGSSEEAAPDGDPFAPQPVPFVYMPIWHDTVFTRSQQLADNNHTQEKAA
jgi:hypothetical protein